MPATTPQALHCQQSLLLQMQPYLTALLNAKGSAELWQFVNSRATRQDTSRFEHILPAFLKLQGAAPQPWYKPCVHTCVAVTNQHNPSHSKGFAWCDLASSQCTPDL